MDQFATDLIRTFGGTSAVARHLEAPTSTVHSWKQSGIPASRLAHLRLVAQVEGIAVDWSSGRKPDEASASSDGEAESMPGSDIPAGASRSPDNGDEVIERGEEWPVPATAEAAE